MVPCRFWPVVRPAADRAYVMRLQATDQRAPTSPIDAATASAAKWGLECGSARVVQRHQARWYFGFRSYVVEIDTADGVADGFGRGVQVACVVPRPFRRRTSEVKTVLPGSDRRGAGMGRLVRGDR